MVNTAPRYVAAKGNDRAGLIHFNASDQLWRASNWSGTIGTYETEKEAEAAIWCAPPRPKPKRPARRPMPSGMQFDGLTAADAGCLVRNQAGGVIGAIRPRDGCFCAWVSGSEIGGFDTTDQARRAIVDADKAKTKREPHG